METTNATPASLLDLDERPLSARQRYAAVLVSCGEFIDGYDLIDMGAALILLRPQFFQELRHAEAMMFCESCGRILFYNPPVSFEEHLAAPHQ